MSLFLALPLLAAEHTIAIVSMAHGHVWGHLPTMVSGKPARLVGVAESIPDLVKEGERLGVPAGLFYSDFVRMLDEKKPEVVWSFAENDRHLEIVKACAPRGIHVIFEKPLASTLADARQIRALARQYHIYVLTNYQMAWWPTQYAAKKEADSGELGAIWRLHGVVGHGGPGDATGIRKYFVEWLYDPEKNGAGALMDFGCYNALWSLWYLGMPQTVYASVLHLRPAEYPKVEDNSAMVLSYKNGVALLEGSWDLPRSFQDLEVFGRKGSVTMTQKKAEVVRGRSAPETLAAEPLPAERAEPIAYMIDCIEKKHEPEGLVGLDMNVDVVEIIEAAKQSIKTGRAVALPLP